MNDTTRRFPRSLAEAFPHERYGAIEHHRRPSALLAAACRAARWSAYILVAAMVLRQYMRG